MHRVWPGAIEREGGKQPCVHYCEVLMPAVAHYATTDAANDAIDMGKRQTKRIGHGIRM